MEEVLEGIADNVATLVLAMSQTDKAFGNIVPGAELIRSAVMGMCEAAKVTARSQAIQVDAKQVLETTAVQLAEVANRLVEQATRGRDNPTVRMDAQKEAIKAAKDVLQKVVLLVMLEDQMNISTFVTSAKRAIDVVRRINAVETPQQLALILPESTAHQQDFMKRARRRMELTKAGDSHDEMQAAIDALTSGVPKHLMTAQTMVVTPSEQTRRETEVAGQEIIAAIDRLITITKDVFARNAKFIGAAFAFRVATPTTSREDDVARYATELRRAAERLMPSVVSGQDPTQAARHFITAANSLLTAARHVALETNDPIRRKMVERCAEDVSDLMPRVVAAIKPVADNPQDAAAVAELRLLTAQARDADDMLHTASVAPSETTVAAAAALVGRNMTELRRAIEQHDAVKAKAELRQIERNYDRFLALAAAYADSISDPEVREAARVAVEQLRVLRPRLVAAAQACIFDPTNPAALHALDDVLQQVQQAMLVLTPPHAQAAACASIVAHEVEALLTAVHEKASGYQQEAVEHAKLAATAMQQLLAHAAKTLETVRDPQRRAQIETAIARCKELLPKLVEATRDALRNPGSREAMAALEAIGAQAKEASADLAALLRPTTEELAAVEAERTRIKLERAHAQEEAAAEAEHKRIAAMTAAAQEAEARHKAEELAKQKAEAERRSEEERARAARLVTEGPRDARIYAAAEQMSMNVPQPQTLGEGTPLQRLAAFGHEIASMMAQLSMHAEQGNKQGMVQVSRKIAASVGDILKLSQTIATKCGDARLRADVLNYAQACQNYAVQLKIVSAVKAASDEDDPTVRDQLVAAATGLAASIVNTVNACQSASLHRSVRTAR